MLEINHRLTLVVAMRQYNTEYVIQYRMRVHDQHQHRYMLRSIAEMEQCILYCAAMVQCI